MSEPKFSLPIRVYYQDTDAGGVVYHSNHLNFMERARYEWLRSLGYDVHGLINTHNVHFLVRSLQIEYFKPAILDDLLNITVDVVEMGRSRISIAQGIFCEQTPLVKAKVHVVCVDTNKMKPIRIPTSLREKIETPT